MPGGSNNWTMKYRETWKLTICSRASEPNVDSWDGFTWGALFPSTRDDQLNEEEYLCKDKAEAREGGYANCHATPEREK
uniref:Uncharacterized protein n=1 Tax=Steinernema glaseri TaxID=37863 RepID=A0A1I7YTI3_9BILA